jgi:hypothetical protein
MTAASEMAAFDHLPAAVRARLAASRFDFKAVTIAADRRAHRLSVAETVAFIGEMEAWAAEAERFAAIGDGNRLTPSLPPRVDEMVQRIRRVRDGVGHGVGGVGQTVT